MAIYNFMDISTGHLTDADVELLDDETLPFAIVKYKYGWIVPTSNFMSLELVDEATQRLSASGFSQQFIEITRTSGERGCWLLRFDADADLEPDLPVGGYGLDPEETAYAETEHPV